MSESGEPMDVTDHVELTNHPPALREDEGPRLVVRESREETEAQREIVFDVRDVSVYYGPFRAVRNVTLPIQGNEITALIGPSGCGKTTFLRTLNRMNDLIVGARIEGEVHYHGVDLYNPQVDPVEVRRRIGMVFQKPNPFPKSIYDNIAFGPKIAGFKGNMDELVEESLHRAALWDEVKDKLKESGLALSGGQQQRLCIARAIATRPDVILMDEPCSALDPIATQRIEDLMQELVSDYTIVIVTHNMQQAATGERPDGVLHRRGEGGRAPHGDGRRVRQDRDDLHESLRSTNRGLRHGAVRLMARPHFHEELEKMELQLLTLGELAGTAVRSAVDAVVGHEDKLAEHVIAGDDEIDTIYLGLDQGIISLLALQQPVAADLRLVSVILHSSLHLERIGDQAVNIAKIHLFTRDLPGNAVIEQQIAEMGDIVVDMVRTAMDALRRRDRELCLRLPGMDDPVDRLNRNMHFEVAKLAGDPPALDWGMQMNLAARALERVGDNAVDIGEQVSFLLTGEFVEFTDASHPGGVTAEAD